MTQNPLEILLQKKDSIIGYLKPFLENQESLANTMFPQMAHTFPRILGFTKGGKTIRGALVLLSKQFYDGSQGNDSNALAVASAMELLQSYLLIHDDIMDRDQVRRGAPSVYIQYADDMGVKEPTMTRENQIRFGEALGICAGDITNFLAYQLISESSLNFQIKSKLNSFMNRELTRVGLAQMLDVFWSGSSEIPNYAEIESMYINKTGRYTFTLPFLLGAVLGSAPLEDFPLLEKLGDNLGILFQIKDDELGLFGDSSLIGKPVGSDIIEGKKTVFIARLFEVLSDQEKQDFLKVFGNVDADEQNLVWVKGIIEEKGIRTDLNKHMDGLLNECFSIIDTLSGTDKESKEMLQSIAHYSRNRSL